MTLIDPYLAPNSKVLDNLLGIKRQSALDEAEANYVSMRLREIAQKLLPGDYDARHLMMMHKYIFQDIYAWAGRIRTVPIYKDEPVLGGLSIEYANVENIESELNNILAKGPDITDVKSLSEWLAALWKIHPFREGNTRTVITFFCQYIEHCDGTVNRDLFEKSSQYIRSALVAYNANFPEINVVGKKSYLENFLKDAIMRKKSTNIDANGI